MDKTNLIIYTIIGLIVFGIVFYSIKTFGSKENTNVDFTAPKIILDESKNDYNNKLANIITNSPVANNIKIGEDFDFNLYKSDSNKNIVIENNKETLEKNAILKTVNKDDKTKKTDTSIVNKPIKRKNNKSNIKNNHTNDTKKTDSKIEQETTINNENVNTETVDNTYKNYGVTVKRSENKEVNNKTIDNYIDAFLLSNTKIKNGTQLIFIISKDTKLDGVYFRKMSRIFSTAVYSSTNVDIIANVVQNTDGKKYNISLTGYNENYQKGIFNNSKVDASINKGSNELVSDVVTIPSSNIQFVSSFLNAAGKATKDIFKKEPEINITEGYKMYFKPD